MPNQPPVNADRLTDAVAELVRIDSVNPDLVPEAAGEAEAADACAAMLERAGLEVTRLERAPGRPSVVGVLRGAGGGPSLMLNGHIDTVGVEGMVNPFEPRIEDGRLYGRGSYDMKGAVAACIEAAVAIAESGVRLAGDLVVTCVADEENASLGMQEVIEHITTDCAIVTEPTSLNLCLAHKGFAWFEIVVEGVAAHGSQHEIGVDANLRMGRFLARLETLERELRRRTPHALVGPPSLHAATIHGGVGPSTYSPRCALHVERRMIPGETIGAVEDEIHAILADLRAEAPELRIDAETLLAREPFEANPDGPAATAVTAACRDVLGAPPEIVGENPWMDSALLQSAGVDTVVIGPHGAGAHAETEWVDLASVHQLAKILIASAMRICGPV
jgi:acetylornithine deacetylase